MITSRNKTNRMILVLTEFSDRDKNASDAAFKLAKKLRMDIMLLHTYTQNNNPGSALQLDDMKYIQEIEIHFDNEKHRLNAQMEGKRKSGFQPSIKSYCSDGTLSENVCCILQREKIEMIVMGGRPLRSNDYLFCTEIDEVLFMSQRPVLVVPEQRTLDI